jgi:hypothetical protein
MLSYTLFGGIMLTPHGEDESTIHLYHSPEPQEKDKLYVCHFWEEASEKTLKKAIRKGIEILYEKDLNWIQIYTEGKKMWDSTESLKSGEEISFDDLSEYDSEDDFSDEDIPIEFNWVEIIKEKIKEKIK